MNRLSFAFIGMIFSVPCYTVGADTLQIVPVHRLHFSPILDGSGSEWASIPTVTIPLRKLVPDSIVEANNVMVKAGYDSDYIYFYFEWVDSEKNTLHKPYLWDEAKNKYLRGPQREDRLALQLAIKGEFSADWRSGNEFTADMWHWKSVRSNPAGLAHDKLLHISSTRMLRSAEIEGRNGPVYIIRKSDSGKSIYTTRRYSKKDKAIMPKYILNDNPSGSVADIKAAGVWSDGKWHLELRRKLNTGYDDDAVFLPGHALKGAISVFDGSENFDHNYSSELLFQL
ncbi:MAG: hypothetical protein GY806_16010 [Gammaproteobacteria bacterium]|nr:hypothetical protein [Gammaproteobacteria bacterium]